MFKKSWMPTVGGIMSAIGTALTSIPEMADIGRALCAVGLVFMGASSKQFNVSGGVK